MTKTLISSLLFAAVPMAGAAMLVTSSPASATKGRDAVGMCIDSTANGSRCAWNVNDKGEIDICNKNGCVYCPSATGDCSVVSQAKPRPRPKWALPAGTKVETALGTHTVSRKVVTDSALLKAMTRKGR